MAGGFCAEAEVNREIRPLSNNRTRDPIALQHERMQEWSRAYLNPVGAACLKAAAVCGFFFARRFEKAQRGAGLICMAGAAKPISSDGVLRDEVGSRNQGRAEAAHECDQAPRLRRQFFMQIFFGRK